MNSEALPDYVERRLENAPVYSRKRQLAAIFTELFGPISHRTVESRPLVWRRVSGYGVAVTPTRPAVEAEYRRFAGAVEYRTGRARKIA
jgi:hypothetical protein